MIDYTIGYIKAHEFSAGHRKRLLQDRKCGCFYCLKIFAPKEISNWIEDVGGTAICPYCGMIPSSGSIAGIPSPENFWSRCANIGFERSQYQHMENFLCGHTVLKSCPWETAIFRAVVFVQHLGAANGKKREEPF